MTRATSRARRAVADRSIWAAVEVITEPLERRTLLAVTLSPAVTWPAGNAAQDIAVADFNSDDKVDLVSADLNAGSSVNLMLGNGTGGYGAPLPTALGVAMVAVAAADLDDDGNMDVVAASTAGNQIVVLYGDGSGSWSSTATLPALGPIDVVVGDFNEDGFGDVAALSSGGNVVQLYLSDANAVLAQPISHQGGIDGRTIATGDFNNDDHLDLVMANQPGSISVILGDGSGNFSVRTVFPPSGVGSSTAAVVGDLNEDGNDDVVLGNLSAPTVGVLLGNGLGGFAFVPPVPAGIGDVNLADFDNDGHLDLVTAQSAAATITVSQGVGNGTFDIGQVIPVAGGFPLRFVEVADLNNDAVTDIVGTTFGADAIVMLNLTQAPAPKFTGPVNWSANDHPQGVASGDFNNDQKLDLAVANADSDDVSILFGNGLGGFSAPTNIPTASAPAYLIAQDVSGDGELDLVVPGVNDGRLYVHLGDGQGNFATPTFYTLAPGGGLINVRAADVTGDQIVDLIVTQAFTDGKVHVLKGLGGGAFDPTGPSFTVGGGARSVVLADFNNDGVLDLALTFLTNVDPRVSIMIGDGTGNFSNPISRMIANLSPWRIAVADFNGDDNQDVAVTYIGGSGFDVMLGNGAGGLGFPVGFASGNSPDDIDALDVNGDGEIDLVVANSGNDHLAVHLGDGTGKFAAPFRFGTGSVPADVEPADYNRDGKVDLAAANYLSKNVSILLNVTQPLALPAPSLSINDVTVTEGTGGTVAATFTITRSGPLGADSDVLWSTANSSAIAPGDFAAVVNGSVHFNAGENSKTITVQVAGDSAQELTETFLVNLSGATGATIADGQGVGTILDNEPRIIATGKTNLDANKKPKYAFTGVVASFTSVDFTSALNFAAAINWGDGKTSAGQIVFNAQTQTWDVIGTHQYTKKGNYTVLVVITDTNGATATATSKLKA